MGKRGPKPQKKVSTEWSKKLAYAVGLIASDGCLSSDGRHIDFTSKDKELVRTFRDCLRIENKIGVKSSGRADHRNRYRVQFGDVYFYKWLQGIGLTPHKSKTIGTLKIPDSYFFDFLRGSFDGDGSIYSYWDPRWHSSYMFYVVFSSASYAHLQWLKENVERISGITGRIKMGTRCHQLVYAKKSSRALFKRMFYAKNLCCLGRKFQKATKIFETDCLHSISPGGGTVYTAA